MNKPAITVPELMRRKRALEGEITSVIGPLIEQFCTDTGVDIQSVSVDFVDGLRVGYRRLRNYNLGRVRVSLAMGD